MNSIVVPTDYSKYSFPELKEHVSRDGLINTIGMYLEENDVVYVYGEEGFGKTSVLAEFVKRSEKNCIALSIDPINKYSYYLESLIRDVVIQVKIYLNQEYDVTNGVYDKKELVKNFGTLEYITKKYNKTIYIVLDGLDQIPDDDDSYIKDLLDYLPFGKRNIKFLFSAKKGMLENNIKVRKSKAVNIDLFSLEETKQVLSGIDDDTLRVFLNSFRATPETLNTVKRLIQKGVTIDDILQMEVENTEGLFEEEWRRAGKVVKEYQDFLGVLAFSKTALTLEQISLEIKQPYEKLVGADKISFIEFFGGYAKFRSVGFAKFARKKLEDYRTKSLRHITNIMSEAPKSLDSLSSLPSYFNELGDTQAVISHLSNENLELLLSESKSLNDLFRQLDLGISCAGSNELEMLRFSFLRSLVTGIKTSPLLKSELKNFLVKEDVKTALDLAQSASSKEEQLQMLCIIASDYKEKEKPLPESIETQIDTLYQGVNPESLGVEKTLDIAMDLLPFDSAKAMSLINQIDQLDGGGENKSEYAFFRFTLQALQKKPDTFDSEIDVKNISEKKRKAIDTIRMFKEGKPAEKIIEGLESFEKIGDRIFILRNWIKSSPQRKGNDRLLEYVIDLSVKTTDYSASAAFYSDVCSCLPYLDSNERVNETYNKIKAQIKTVQRIGPTVSLVEMLLNVSDYEKKNNIESITYQYICNHIVDNVQDKAVALAALSLLGGRVKDDESLIHTISEVKEDYFNQVINSTANQFEILKEAFFYESLSNLVNAITWSNKLNTGFRRSEAKSFVISSYCDHYDGYNSAEAASIDMLCLEIRGISVPQHRDECILYLIGYLSKVECISKNDFKKVAKLALRSKNNSNICKFSSKIIQILKKKKISLPEQENKLKQAMLQAWRNLDSECVKVDHAFKISNVVSQSDIPLSEEYARLAIELRREASVDNEEVLHAFVSSVDLQIRSLFFLVRNNAYDEEDVIIILDQINKIPSVSLRAKQLARLASVFQKNLKEGEAKKVIEDYILPLLDSLGDVYSTQYLTSVYLTAPVIYKYSQVSLIRLIESVKRNDVFLYDRVVGRCVEYLLRDCIIGDPFDPVKNHDYNLSYVEIECLLDLVGFFCEDSSAFFYLGEIARIITNLRKKKTLSEPQFNSIIAKFKCFEEGLFPKSNGIVHEGYKICAKAVRLNVADCKNAQEWQSLLQEARIIPNASDRSFVIATIADLMPASLTKERNEVYEEALIIIADVPSFSDKMGRYEYLINISKRTNKSFAKRCLRHAFVLSSNEESEEHYSYRLSLIDAAYGIDEDFPETLSTVYNDDPARKAILEKNIFKKKREAEEKKKFDPEVQNIAYAPEQDKYSDLAWQMLGKLNANNHAPIKTNNYGLFLKGVSEYDYEGMYPLLSYYIHMLGSKFQGRQNSQKYIRPIFDIFRSCTDSFSKIYRLEVSSKYKVGAVDQERSVVVDVNEMEKAIAFVRSWVEELKGEDIFIFDPYFSIEDFGFVGQVINKDPDFNLTILTTLRQKRRIEVECQGDVIDAIVNYWHEHVSTDDLPSIEIIFAGTESMGWELPIHDRWWLSEDGGVSIGTSLNGVGKKLSCFKKMEIDEAAEIEQKLEAYARKKQRYFDDKRVRYETISI